MIVAVYGIRDRAAAERGRLHLTRDGRVRLEGFNRPMARFIRNLPAWRYGVRYTIADGEPWLRELPAALRGVYLWGEVVRPEGRGRAGG